MCAMYIGKENFSVLFVSKVDFNTIRLFYECNYSFLENL